LKFIKADSLAKESWPDATVEVAGIAGLEPDRGGNLQCLHQVQLFMPRKTLPEHAPSRLGNRLHTVVPGAR
jgi:hypothetical protein